MTKSKSKKQNTHLDSTLEKPLGKIFAEKYDIRFDNTTFTLFALGNYAVFVVKFC